MGIALTALSDAYTLIRHNPVILAVGWIAAILFGIVNAATGFVLGLIPLVGPLVSQFVSVVLWAVFLAGLLALIYAGRDGEASLSHFLEGIRDHSLSLLGAFLAIGTLFFVLVVGGTIATVFVMPTGGAAVGTAPGGVGGAAGPAPGLAAGAALLPLLALGLGLLVLGVLFQFADVAIVVGETSALGSFGASFEVFRRSPLSALGYTVLRAVLGAFFFFVPVIVFLTTIGGITSAALDPAGGGGDLLGALGIASLVFALVWLVVIVPLGQAVLYTYHVAFFNRYEARAA